MDYINFHVFGKLVVLACVQTSPIPLLPREGKETRDVCTQARFYSCFLSRLSLLSGQPWSMKNWYFFCDLLENPQPSLHKR